MTLTSFRIAGRILPACLVFLNLNTVSSAPSLPQGLATTDWSSILAAHDAANRAIVAVNDGSHAARNPSQQWNIDFDEGGFSVRPDSASWSWGLRLRHYEAGRAVTLREPKSVASEADRLVYRWDDTVQEWFVNTPHGLQQGWTFSRAPADSSSLQIVLDVSGELTPRVSADAKSVAFEDESAGTALTYSGLHAWDADGKSVPVRFATLPGEPTAFAVRVDTSRARFPVTIDPIAQQAFFKASNTGAGDSFGIALAASGNTVVVGAPYEESASKGVGGNQTDNSANGAGAVYVFVRNGGTWSQQAYLKASNTETGDTFGISVAISGDTVVVGAHGEDSGASGVGGSQTDNSASIAGAAYVFVRNSGVWTQQAYLKASNPGSFDYFGESVAISGDTIVAGAIGEDSTSSVVNGNQLDNSGDYNGAAYVFVRNGSVWSQQAYLKASNSGSLDFFGRSVAISGDTLVVGANGEDSAAVGVGGNQSNNSANSAGAAYVFARNGSVWSQQAYLKASNTGSDDRFAESVAISGDTVIVAAAQEDSSAIGVGGDQANNSAVNSGAVYAFVRNVGVWTQQAYLKASNTGVSDVFGAAVAISGDLMVVGANLENSSAVGAGGNQSDNSADDAGAAYVFARNGGVWTQLAYLKASNTGAGDRFGQSVAILGDTVLVGAEQEDSAHTGIGGTQADNDNSASNAGAVYVFQIPMPTVKAKGKARITTSRKRVVLRGSTVDATLVEFKAGKGGFKTAKGTAASWKIPVRLTKSRTAVKVRATGAGGTSKILKIVVLRK